MCRLQCRVFGFGFLHPAAPLSLPLVLLRVAPKCELCHGMPPELIAKDGLVDEKLFLGPLVEPVLRLFKHEQEDIDTGDVLSHCRSQVPDKFTVPTLGVSKTLSVCKIGKER